MFYRLPTLFSISFYLFVLGAQIVFLLNGIEYINFNNDFWTFLSREMLYNVCPFFFVLILTSCFFYQNKIYFYTSKNVKLTLIISIISAIIFSTAKLIFTNLIIKFFLFSTLNSTRYGDSYSYGVIDITAHILSYVGLFWAFVFIAMLLFIMIKVTKSFFNSPLIDNASQPSRQQYSLTTNHLSSVSTVIEYKKLYAIIFASSFCCIAYGIIWFFYFDVFIMIEELDYFITNNYLLFLVFAWFVIILNYVFLYLISQKFIQKTYSWLPVLSLFIASLITLIAFGVIAFAVNTLFLIAIVMVSGLFQFILLSLLLFVDYFVLYWLTRFSLKRFFA